MSKKTFKDGFVGFFSTIKSTFINSEFVGFVTAYIVSIAPIAIGAYFLYKYLV